MKSFRVPCLTVFPLALLAALFLATPSVRAQQQEDQSQKTQPKLKVLPKPPAGPASGQVAQFKIGEFTVIVGVPSGSGGQKPAEPADRTAVVSPVAKDESGYSGQGHIIIRSKRVSVTFRGIVVAPAASGKVPVATAGTVTGTAGPAVEYQWDRFDVKLERPSIRLAPDGATAAAVVTLVQAPFMAAGRDGVLTLSAASCRVRPDGSIAGEDFRGQSGFVLKGSKYQLEIPADAPQSVHLGTAVSGPGGRSKAPTGCVLKGEASFEGTPLFAFQGTVDPSGKSAVFDLVLASPPLVRTPEPGYELTLQSGSVKFTYAANGGLTCDGGFIAGIKFPPAVKRFDSQTLELRNLTLKTDATGALFNTITIPDRLRAGFGPAGRPSEGLFLLDPLPGAVWAYFPKWQAPGPNSSYPMLQGNMKITDVNPDCEAVLRFLETPAPGVVPPKNAPEKNVLRRPGVTVLQGTLYLKSRQATFKSAQASGPADPAAAEFNLKTQFWGGLTMTPWGITGTATSAGSSFVPSVLPIEECSKPSGASRPTWDEILDAGARKPVEPAERFRLAGLRILEMRVESLRLCANALPEGGASMRYIVHFPFPSFIDLDFADSSLDTRGLFASAAGPVASRSWAFPQNPSRAEVDAALAGQLKKGVQEKLNPDTHILWQWRLPVSFSDRGVVIAYKGATGPANVNVTMKPYDPAAQEIMSSEIWLRPLFSRNSGIKAGVRFAAALDPEGGFRLTDWDQSLLTFAKLYAAPKTELTVGFDCRLNPVSENGIALANAAGDPARRTADVRWDGGIRFPFFEGRDEKFQDVSFMVRNLSPDMPGPIAVMTDTNPASSQCRTIDGRATETPGQDAGHTLTATIRNLRYSKTSYPFQSQDATVVKSDGEFRGVAAYFSSFTCAEIRLEVRPEDRPIPLHATTDACGGTRTARHMLKNAIPNTAIVDLICYDRPAYAARGLTDACCQEYWLGTYEVSTGSVGAEKVVFTATNAKWYPKATPFALFFNSSDAVLSSDEIDNPHRTFINIPGAGLKQDDAGALVGAFGATMTSLACSLPYEGEFRFYLDPNCGFFYLLSGGSFTYYLRFSGEVFIVHAPYKLLKRPPDFIGETRLMETLSVRALFPDPDDFVKKTGLSQLSDNTVVSGVFQAGNASYGFGASVLSVNLAAGAGTYLYQFSSGTGTKYCFGTFQNARAIASAAIVSAEADLILAQGPITTGTVGSLEEFFGRAELTASGTLVLCACADIWLAHTEVQARGDAVFSTRTGLTFMGSIKAGAGAGGCSPCR
jgi:hypothetical protein